MDLGEGGLGIAEAAGGEVEEAVALVAEAVEVAALVPALVRRVHGQGLVLLNVLQPPAQVGADQVAPDQVRKSTPHASHRRPSASPAACGRCEWRRQVERGGGRRHPPSDEDVLCLSSRP